MFRTHELPESPEVAAAPWPKLVDTPAAPAKGIYTAAAPDPAAGTATTVDLGLEARDSAARAEALSAPVLSAADLRRLGRKP